MLAQIFDCSFVSAILVAATVKTLAVVVGTSRTMLLSTRRVPSSFKSLRYFSRAFWLIATKTSLFLTMGKPILSSAMMTSLFAALPLASAP